MNLFTVLIGQWSNTGHRGPVLSNAVFSSCILLLWWIGMFPHLQHMSTCSLIFATCYPRGRSIRNHSAGSAVWATCSDNIPAAQHKFYHMTMMSKPLLAHSRQTWFSCWYSLWSTYTPTSWGCGNSTLLPTYPSMSTLSKTLEIITFLALPASGRHLWPLVCI